MANVEDLIKLLDSTKAELLMAIRQAKINPSQVQLTALSDLAKTLGLIQAGEFRGGNGKDIGKGFSGVSLSENGLLAYKNDIITGSIDSDGDWSVGSDVTAPGTTGFKIFSTAQTYNGEAMGAGDVLIGDNTLGMANLLWDASAAALYLRSGQIITNSLAGGALSAVGAGVRNTNALFVGAGAQVDVAFESINYDDGFVNLVTHPTTLVIPTGQAGYYAVGYTVSVDETVASATASFYTTVLNGSASAGQWWLDLNIGDQPIITGSGEIYAAVGDGLKVSITNSDSIAHTFFCWFWIRRVR